MDRKMDKEIKVKLESLGSSFKNILNESNPNVVASLKRLGFSDSEIRSIELFDWFQGVGLYGFYKLYEKTKDNKYIDILESYYNIRIKEGLPKKNINSMAPLLTMLCMYEINKNQIYKSICMEWAQWLYTSLPRTKEGGFQHVTCEANNDGELWDDTLFMSVLFLAKAGVVFQRNDYVEEALYQFSIHTKYLTDKKTGLWFHGWTFEGRHNFVNALWARGNCWITIFIPEILEYLKDYDLPQNTRRAFIETLNLQVEALAKYQAGNGLWHTLINDDTSYLEASATCGFGYGILKAVKMSLIDKKYFENGMRAVNAVLPLINKDGILEQVSGGTAMGKQSLDFYKNIPLVPKPYGQAMAMLLLIMI